MSPEQQTQSSSWGSVSSPSTTVGGSGTPSSPLQLAQSSSTGVVDSASLSGPGVLATTEDALQFQAPEAKMASAEFLARLSRSYQQIPLCTDSER